MSRIAPALLQSMAGISKSIVFKIGSDGRVRVQGEDRARVEVDSEDLERRRRLGGHSERAIQPGGPGTPWLYPEPDDAEVKWQGTWQRHRGSGGWGVRIETDQPKRVCKGDVVRVTRRDGTTSLVVVGGVWRGDNVALVTPAATASTDP